MNNSERNLFKHSNWWDAARAKAFCDFVMDEHRAIYDSGDFRLLRKWHAPFLEGHVGVPLIDWPCALPKQKLTWVARNKGVYITFRQREVLAHAARKRLGV